MLSPIFSPANMRDIASSVEEKVDLLVDKLKQKCQSEKGFDIYEQFQMLTLDVIAQLGKYKKNYLI